MANMRDPNKIKLGVFLEPTNYELLQLLCKQQNRNMTEIVKLAIKSMAEREGLKNADTTSAEPAAFC